MIKSLDVESKIEIICPSLSLEELEIIVPFLYKGKVSVPDEELACKTSKNLMELFGFPLIAVESLYKPKLFGSYNMDNNFGFFNAKLYCEGALILVCVFVEL